MLENISRLGKVLNRKEQKKVSGGRLLNIKVITEVEDQCLNILGMSVNTTSCNCADISENDELCAL
ncbi:MULTISPECIES: hypothetical protein [Aquimarina]|uniref:hypothetical protein n=1 Tax=Aquimarina TaxID=290174 RepID=UPI000944798B|nr:MULTISPECIES: hypothetical protein [Aquimarina]